MDEAPKPRFPKQPNRRKFERDRALDRAWRSKSFNARPVCPSCGQVAPAPDKAREEWIEPHGHRRPDGEVCPGFRKAPSIAAPPPMQLKPLPAFKAGAPLGPTWPVPLFLLPPVASGESSEPRRRLRVDVANEVNLPPFVPLFESIEELMRDAA